MSFSPSLPGYEGVRLIHTLNPATGRTLVAFHITAPLDAGPLQAAHKKLIAACVSRLKPASTATGCIPKPPRPSPCACSTS